MSGGGPTKLLLGRRLTLVVAGMAAVLAAGYLFAGVWFAKIQLENEFQENAQLVAASLASSLIEAMLTYNLHEIPDLLDNAQLANKNIAYAFVSDLDGNPVAHTRNFKQGVPGDLQKIARKYAEPGNGHRSLVLRTEDGDVFHLIFPLEGRPGGYLHLGFSLTQLDSKLRVTARHLISSMLLGLVLSALVGGQVYRRMAQPIGELTSAAAEFGAGNLTRRVPPRPRAEDEAAMLAVAFNRMADQLQDKVTELENSRAALADEKARVQAILDGMMHGVIFYDPDGAVGYLNKTAREYWGWLEGVPPGSHEAVHAGSPEAMQAVEFVIAGLRESSHVQIRRGDRILDLFVSSMRREGGGFLGVVEIIADITERVASARALAHAEKLNVVGQLAAGVAHEINSPLDGAIEAARIIERGQAAPEEVRNYARAQRAALERIAAIVYRLLTFSRKEQSRTGSAPVWTVISEAVELVKYRLTRQKIVVEMPERSEVPFMVEGEVIELSQILVNLLSNAIDASPDHGRVRIEVSAGAGDIVISVSDQGQGIPESLEHLLFTPFFTTKEVGKGTGLGLAICKNLVEQMGGWMDFINEEPPWGARFNVHLPWNGAVSDDTEERPSNMKGTRT